MDWNFFAQNFIIKLNKQEMQSWADGFKTHKVPCLLDKKIIRLWKVLISSYHLWEFSAPDIEKIISLLHNIF